MKKVEINEDNPYILLAVYGTLRDGYGNHSKYLKGKSEYLGTYKTEPKYTMYSGGGFPIVSTNGSTPIVYDLFKIRVNGVLDRIHQLESFTGYIGHRNNWYDMEEFENAEHGTCYMYVQHDKFEEKNIIKSGDWTTKHL